VTTGPELTFPLVPRFRLVGLAFGGMHSTRRGVGSDVAGSRPYQPWDHLWSIDWAASARVSSARGTDEFIVRERFAEEAPRVVIVADRRPAMRLYPAEFPWLSKPEALATAAGLIAASAFRVRGTVGYLDFANVAHPDPAERSAEPFWRSPGSQAGLNRAVARDIAWEVFHAPEDNLTRAFDHLFHVRRSLTPGTFVFVLSDFLEPPPIDAWLRALEHRWDVVPVIIQDPTWEQSFPDVHSIAVPIWDATTGAMGTLRLSQREARERRERNERRLADLLSDFGRLELEPLLLSGSGPEQVLEPFLAWAERRLFLSGQWRHAV
jgi:uncharacterized protein (DUF58 family)